MSKYMSKQEAEEIPFVDMGDGEEQEWGGYQGFRSNYRDSGTYNQEEDGRRIIDSRPEVESLRLGGGFVSAISNVSGISDDGYKSRYLKALKELNNVLKANDKIKNELSQTESRLMELQVNQPQSSLINSQMEQLRQINMKLQNKIKEILEINKDCQIQISEKENLRKEFEKIRSELSWKLEGKDQEIYSIKDGYERQLQNLNDTINKLEIANSAFKTQESNLKQMYGGKEESNFKKISYLETQLQQTKSQLTKQREKVNTEIQGMSMRIRKQTQSQLANYKLEMTKLKDSNIESNRENERLTKELRQINDRRAEKKSLEQRHISELQESVQNCKKEIRRLKENLSNTHNIEIQKQSLQKEVKVLQQYMHNLTQESAEAKARSTSLQNSNEQLMNTNTRLEVEIQKMKVDNEKLEAEIKRKETIINRHKTQSDTLKSKVVKLQVEHTKNEGTGSRGNISELQDRIRQLKNKVNLLGAGKNMFEEDREEMERERIQTINNLTSTLEEKMEIIVRENEQINKRLLHYKEKCSVIQKKYDSANSQMKVLSTKVEKYENFVPKLQHELERAIKQSQYVQPINSSQYLNPSENLLKDKLKQMNDRLVLEAKYAKQELETKCLQYDSKLVSAKLEISKLKQALKGQSFFHNRITELSQKLSDAENRKLELTKKVGDLERQRLLAERLPVTLQKQLQTNKNTMYSTNREVEQLRAILVEKDRQIARTKMNSHSVQSPKSDYQKQELLNQISHLKSQNNTLFRYKQQSEQKLVSLQNDLARNSVRQNGSQSYTFTNETSDELEKLREENQMLKEFQKSYFELEEKSSIIIKTFEEFKGRYESVVNENVSLKEQNEGLRNKQTEYEGKIENMQQMFDVVYKRLQEALYQNSELLNENNRFKGVTAVTTEEMIPNLPYGKTMSAEEKILVQDFDMERFDSAPEQNQTARFQTREEKKTYKKQFQTALFGSNSDNSYEMQFKGDEHYGEYY